MLLRKMSINYHIYLFLSVCIFCSFLLCFCSGHIFLQILWKSQHYLFSDFSIHILSMHTSIVKISSSYAFISHLICILYKLVEYVNRMQERCHSIVQEMNRTVRRLLNSKLVPSPNRRESTGIGWNRFHSIPPYFSYTNNGNQYIPCHTFQLIKSSFKTYSQNTNQIHTHTKTVHAHSLTDIYAKKPAPSPHFPHLHTGIMDDTHFLWTCVCLHDNPNQ